jgi:hypothetical protein
VQIKDLVEGAKAAAAITSNQEWRETRPAQFSCKEEELVDKVREILGDNVVTEKSRKPSIIRMADLVLHFFGFVTVAVEK